MISIVMPFWNRQSHLDGAIEMYATLYPNLPFELIVVDDGSPTTANVSEPFATVLRLPAKDHPLNPCVPINEGVKRARGEYLVLTNPEIRHRGPILGALIERTQWRGVKAYSAAACYGKDTQLWHCHSLFKDPGQGPKPAGGGLHFLAAMHRTLFWAAGGFDEEYRPWPGYDDNDFLYRLHAVGADLQIYDDLVVEHERTPSGWKGHVNNQKLFESKWPQATRPA